MRGIRNQIKRRKIFRYLRKTDADIIMLQEVHGCHKTNNLWQSEWGFKIFFANGMSNARGVAILLNKKTGKLNFDVTRDINGHFIVLKFKMNDCNYTVINVYAPNTDSPEFFQDIQKYIANQESDLVIWGGDFNVTLNTNIDRSTIMGECNTNAQKQLIEVINSEKLVDCWRNCNPNEKRFTWHRSAPNWSWSRIDFFLISECLINRLVKCDITPGILSDHCVISAEFEACNTSRGKGLWKLNTELLKNETFVNTLKGHIRLLLLMYNNLDAKSMWELIKIECARMCQDESKRVKNERGWQELKLFQLKELLQSDWMNHPENVNICNTLRSVDTELNEIANEDDKAALFRCRANWF